MSTKNVFLRDYHWFVIRADQNLWFWFLLQNFFPKIVCWKKKQVSLADDGPTFRAPNPGSIADREAVIRDMFADLIGGGGGVIFGQNKMARGGWGASDLNSVLPESNV